MNRPRAFTLIELLVVITIIGVLLGILLPQLGTSRETSRRLKCLTNLRGIGMGLAVYLNDSKGLLPRVRPLHQPLPYEPQNDKSLLDLLADYVDAPVPKQGPDGYFEVHDPYKCPSDISSDDAGVNYEPVWRVDGVSYEYIPGGFMLLAELVLVRDPQFGVTRAYENDRRWPILTDQGQWHKLRKSGPAQNTLYFPDMRADWAVELRPDELGKFFEEVRRFGGGGMP